MIYSNYVIGTKDEAIFMEKLNLATYNCKSSVGLLMLMKNSNLTLNLFKFTNRRNNLAEKRDTWLI